MNKKFVTFACLLCLILCTIPAFASGKDEYSCEVMSASTGVQTMGPGAQTRQLKSGDILWANARITVPKGGTLDIAYDKDRENVTRVSDKSLLIIKSIHPTAINLQTGDLIAKLKKLPAGSSFRIETPTAVAAVRGSFYRTVVVGARTDVFNLGESPVEVESKEFKGPQGKGSLTLDQNQKTSVASPGAAPSKPVKMTGEEMKDVVRFEASLDKAVAVAAKQGRAAIQSVEAVEGLPDSAEQVKKINAYAAGYGQGKAKTEPVSEVPNAVSAEEKQSGGGTGMERQTADVNAQKDAPQAKDRSAAETSIEPGASEGSGK